MLWETFVGSFSSACIWFSASAKDINFRNALDNWRESRSLIVGSARVAAKCAAPVSSTLPRT